MESQVSEKQIALLTEDNFVKVKFKKKSWNRYNFPETFVSHEKWKPNSVLVFYVIGTVGILKVLSWNVSD